MLGFNVLNARRAVCPLPRYRSLFFLYGNCLDENHLTGFLKILRYHTSCKAIQRGDVRADGRILIGFHGGTIMSDIFLARPTSSSLLYWSCSRCWPVSLLMATSLAGCCVMTSPPPPPSALRAKVECQGYETLPGPSLSDVIKHRMGREAEFMGILLHKLIELGGKLLKAVFCSSVCDCGTYCTAELEGK
jgi:hypothetical protein